MSSPIADVLIIGGGPAGLQGALTLSRIRRTSKIFDSSDYRNNPARLSSAEMHTFPLADGLPVYEYHAKAWAEINKYGSSQLIKKAVISAKKESNGRFIIEDDSGGKHRGRKVIVASGAVDVLPDVPGLQELWGPASGACPYCHGYEEIDRRIACWLPASPMHIATYGIWSTLSDRPLVIVTGGTPVPEPVKDALDSLLVHGHQLIEDVINKVEPLDPSQVEHPGMRIHFSTKRQPLEIDFLVIGAPTKQRAPKVVEDLGLELDQMGNIKTTDMFLHTTVEGVFAAGDSTVMAKAVPNAVSSGGFAGAGCGHDLVTEDLKLRLPSMPMPTPQAPLAKKTDGVVSAGMPPPVKA